MPRKSAYKSALGLLFDGKSNETPILSIKEEGVCADEIVKIAKRYGIPVLEKPNLAKALKNIEIDQPVPEELFEAVAIVINQIESKTK